MSSQFDSLAAFLPPDWLEYELVVAHPGSEWLSTADFDMLFDSNTVDVSHLEVPDADQETLFLFHDEEVIASSPTRELIDAIAEVDTMIRTGSVESLESFALPSVLGELDEVPFAAAGPDDSSLKLLFTTISRHIEARAVEVGDGQLRAGFQRLSRFQLAEEDHTRVVYEHLADTDVDVHVYGRPDWTPPASLGTTMHGGYTEDFLRNWFVVYRSADEAVSAAFLAHDHGTGAWRGHWTFQDDRVGQINRYLERCL
ncbi:MAG: DICT sensory domain-containing protein [Halobacteriota archaeon]